MTSLHLLLRGAEFVFIYFYMIQCLWHNMYIYICIYNMLQVLFLLFYTLFGLDNAQYVWLNIPISNTQIFSFICVEIINGTSTVVLLLQYNKLATATRCCPGRCRRCTRWCRSPTTAPSAPPSPSPQRGSCPCAGPTGDYLATIYHNETRIIKIFTNKQFD